MSEQMRDRVVELRRVRAGDLRPNPRNWRLHPRHQEEALRDLLAEIGFADAVLARELEDGALELVDGHLRRSIDPDAVVPVLILDVDEAEADKLLVTLDPLAALATADPEPLRALLESVGTASEDVRMMLADLATSTDLASILPPTDPDKIPDRGSPRAQVGDIFLLGDHRIACGDARDESVLAAVTGDDSARLLLTDPPYGVDYVGKTSDRLRLSNDGASGLPELLCSAFATADRHLVPGAAIYVFHPAGPQSMVFVDAIVGAGWE
jgi:hypothetical protein